MRAILKIIGFLFILNLVIIGISYIAPGFLKAADSYQILIQKLIITKLDQLSTDKGTGEGRPNCYTKDAISYSELKQVLDTLSPGTIFFSIHGKVVSNYFIKGDWKHCGIFLGSRKQVEQFWGKDHHICQLADQFSTEEDDYMVFDASYETGVSIHSIRKIADLDKNSTLRKLLFFQLHNSKEEIAQIILDGSRHIGKEYDYCFVLNDDKALYCSEFLYELLPFENTYFTPSRVHGRRMLLPSDLVHTIRTKGLASGDFGEGIAMAKDQGQVIRTAY